MYFRSSPSTVSSAETASSTLLAPDTEFAETATTTVSTAWRPPHKCSIDGRRPLYSDLIVFPIDIQFTTCQGPLHGDLVLAPITGFPSRLIFFDPPLLQINHVKIRSGRKINHHRPTYSDFWLLHSRPLFTNCGLHQVRSWLQLMLTQMIKSDIRLQKPLILFNYRRYFVLQRRHPPSADTQPDRFSKRFPSPPLLPPAIIT